MADFKSSKEQLEHAKSNLNNKAGNNNVESEIIKSTANLSSAINNQNKALLDLKNSIDNRNARDRDSAENINSSLRSSIGYLTSISSKLSAIQGNVSSLQGAVTSIKKETDVTVSLLGSIKTSLVQITSVLSAFRADYILAQNGKPVNGNGYYNQSLLMRDISSLNSINNKLLKNSLREIKNAVQFADLMSDSVRNKIGNNKKASANGSSIFNRISSRFLGDELGPILTMLPGMLGIDDTNIKTLVSSIGDKFDSNFSKKYVNPLNQAITDILGKDGGTTGVFKKFLAGKIADATGLGDAETKQRETDPNLVLSSLAPYADDIKDMVKAKYEAVSSRPKRIPIYATPVWIVNSAYQENGFEKRHSKGKTYGDKFAKARFRNAMAGNLNNKKDENGNDLFSFDAATGEFSGSIIDNYLKSNKLENASYDEQFNALSQAMANINAEKQKGKTNTTYVYEDITGRRGQATVSNTYNLLDNLDTELGSQIIRAITGDPSALLEIGGEMLTSSGRRNFVGKVKNDASNIKGSVKNTFSSMSKARDNEKRPDYFANILDKKLHRIYPDDQDINNKIDDLIQVIFGEVNFTKSKYYEIDEETEAIIRDSISAIFGEDEEDSVFYAVVDSLNESVNYTGKQNRQALRSERKENIKNKFRALVGHAGGRNALGIDTKEKEVRALKPGDTVVPKNKVDKFYTMEDLSSASMVLATALTSLTSIEGQTVYYLGQGVNEGKITKSKKKFPNPFSSLTNLIKSSKLSNKVNKTIQDLISQSSTDDYIDEKDKETDKQKRMTSDEYWGRDTEGTEESNEEQKDNSILGGVVDSVKEKINANPLVQKANKVQDVLNDPTKAIKDSLTSKIEKLKTDAEKSRIEEDKKERQELNRRREENLNRINEAQLNAIKENNKQDSDLANELSNQEINAAQSNANIERASVESAESIRNTTEEQISTLEINSERERDLIEDTAVTQQTAMETTTAVNAEVAKLQGASGEAEGQASSSKVLAIAKSAAKMAVIAGTIGSGIAMIKAMANGKKTKNTGATATPSSNNASKPNDKEDKKELRKAEKEYEKEEKEKNKEKKERKKTLAIGAGSALADLARKSAPTVKKNFKESLTWVGDKMNKAKDSFIEGGKAIDEYIYNGGKIAGQNFVKSAKWIGNKVKKYAPIVLDKGKEIFNNTKDKLNKIDPDKKEKMMKMLLISSNPVLFLGNKLLKKVTNLQNSPLGQLMTKSPEKASELMFNVTPGSTALTLSKTVGNNLKSLSQSALGKLSDFISSAFGTNVKFSKGSLSQDLSSGTFNENATIAYGQSRSREATNRTVDSFMKSLGLGNKTNTSNNGDIYTTSKIVDEERKKKGIKLGVVNASASSASASSKGGTADLIKAAAEVCLAYKAAQGNFAYSHSAVTLTFPDGQVIKQRPDCSGYMSAIINRMGYQLSPGSDGTFATYGDTGMNTVTDASSTQPPIYKDGKVSTDWIFVSGGKNPDALQPGDIVFRSSAWLPKRGDGHTGMFMGWKSAGNMAGFDYGSANSMNATLKLAEYINENGSIPTSNDLGFCSLGNNDERADRILRYVGRPVSGSMSTASVSGSADKFFIDDLKLNPGNPTSRGFAQHAGTDYLAKSGTEVHTPTGGIVTHDSISDGISSSMGRFVIVKDNDGKYWRYMHFSQQPTVTKGDKLVPGQSIGYSGGDVSDPNRGSSSGPHLHVDLSTQDTWNGKNGGMLDVQTYNLTGKGKVIPHLYQRDYSNVSFNRSGDTVKQTLGDSGCGPAAASTIKKIYGKGKENNKTDDNKPMATAEASSTNNKGSALGKSASRTDSFGKTFSVTISQDHIELFNTLKSAGCSDAAACGALGNWCQECGPDGMRTWATKHGTYGGGIMQWTPWSKHEDWARSHGYSSPWTWEANLAHIQDELKTGGNWNNPKNASPSLESKGYTPCSSTAEWMQLTDPASAAVNYERAFEVSGDWNGRNSEGINYQNWQLYDNCRVQYAICMYECLVGTWDGTSVVGTSTASPSASNLAVNGWINLVTDSFVSGDVISNYVDTSDSIWNEDNNNTSTATPSIITPSEDTSISDSASSVASPSQTDNFNPPSVNSNVNSINNSNINNNTNNNIPSSIIGNTTTNGGNTQTVLTKSGSNLVINSNGNNTIVVCNNISDKTKTKLDDVVSNFEHLNKTQNRALSVLRAISSLIKEDNPDNALDLRLNNDGLDLLLKGI